MFPMVSRMLKRQALQQQVRRQTFAQFKNRVVSTFRSIPVKTEQFNTLYAETNQYGYKK